MKQSQEINLTGGARIGNKNASYPFAKLIVIENKLILNVSFIGHFEFESKDILLIEEYKLIPFLGQGIRIFHRIPEYNSKIIFWSYQNPGLLINQIKQTGFLDDKTHIISEDDLKSIARIKQNEFPINPITCFVLFFLTFLVFTNSFLFFPFKDGGFEIIERFALVISGVISFSTSLTLLSSRIQKLIIVKDRNFNDVRNVFIFLAIISSLILVSFLILPNITL